jgi:hypothetical protein
MHKNLVFLLFFLSTPLFGQKTPPPAPSQDAAENTIPLARVVKQVTSAIEEYQSIREEGSDALPPLSSAEFDFKTITKKTEGLSLQILIFKIGGSHEKDVTSDLTFTYKPAANAAAPDIIKGHDHHPPVVDLKDELLRTLLSAAEVIKDAGPVASLPINQLVVNLNFGVTWDGNGGVQAPISIVTIGLTGDYNKNSIQSVRLTFGGK